MKPILLLPTSTAFLFLLGSSDLLDGFRDVLRALFPEEVPLGAIVHSLCHRNDSIRRRCRLLLSQKLNDRSKLIIPRFLRDGWVRQLNRQLNDHAEILDI